MAGTLTISTLSDGTNSTSSTNCIQGSAKAWVNFVGTTGAVTTSYNVSSVTRTGTGVYSVNLTNALANANPSAVATTGYGNVYAVIQGVTMTSTLIPITTLTGTGAAGFDAPFVCVAVFSS